MKEMNCGIANKLPGVRDHRAASLTAPQFKMAGVSTVGAVVNHSADIALDDGGHPAACQRAIETLP